MDELKDQILNQMEEETSNEVSPETEEGGSEEDAEKTPEGEEGASENA